MRNYVGTSEASRCIPFAASLSVFLFEVLQLERNKGEEKMRRRGKDEEGECRRECSPPEDLKRWSVCEI